MRFFSMFVNLFFRSNWTSICSRCYICSINILTKKGYERKKLERSNTLLLFLLLLLLLLFYFLVGEGVWGGGHGALPLRVSNSCPAPCFLKEAVCWAMCAGLWVLLLFYLELLTRNQAHSAVIGFVNTRYLLGRADFG